jgi:hypothetical protein
MRRLWLVVAVQALGATASVQAAAPVDRADFVRRADTLCEHATPRAEKLVRQAFEEINRQDLGAAAKKLVKAYRLVRKTFHRIADLSTPRQDADRIRKWVDLSLRSTRVGVDAVQALRAEELERAKRLSKRSVRISRSANDVVRFWGFQHCV